MRISRKAGEIKGLCGGVHRVRRTCLLQAGARQTRRLQDLGFMALIPGKMTGAKGPGRA